MVTKLKLNQQEYHDLKKVLKRFESKANRQLNLNRLIKLWADFVGCVEKGYTDSIYEYTNDLSARNILEEILSLVNSQTQKKIEQLFLPWDERFIGATRLIKKPVIGAQSRSIWSWRVPLILKGELLEDFKTEGLVEK